MYEEFIQSEFQLSVQTAASNCKHLSIQTELFITSFSNSVESEKQKRIQTAVKTKSRWFGRKGFVEGLFCRSLWNQFFKEKCQRTAVDHPVAEHLNWTNPPPDLCRSGFIFTPTDRKSFKKHTEQEDALCCFLLLLFFCLFHPKSDFLFFLFFSSAHWQKNGL